MSDDLKKKGPPDRTRINIHETWEVQWWCGKWGITEAQLIAAVKAKGVMAKDVAAYLNKPYPV